MPRPDIDGRLSGVRGAAGSECGLSIVASALLATTRLPLYTPSASCRRSHFARSATLELAPPAGAWASASRVNPGFRSWWAREGDAISRGRRDRWSLCACAPCAHAWRWGGRPGGGGSGGVERGDRRWRLDGGGVEDLALGVGEPRGLLDGAVGAGEGDEVQASEFERDSSPGVAGLALADADQQQRQPADQHVRADAVLEAVKDRAQFERGFEIAEAAFGFEQVLVAECDVLGGEIGV